ncbi:putative MFS-1 domain protein [Rhizoctonia solani 123E]|uniref:Putative MFS-1 domain protein n=1 Tax=Rhizoctonia solani 123E TaxID=1423351 RepID=A0A074S398_9AGAM|nr:putative MFS-1 domain protein [Rhizoctonia solani 123E]
MNILYAFFGLVSPFIIGAPAKAGAAWKLYYWFPFSLARLVTICHFVLFKHYVMPSDHEEAPEFKSVREKFKRVMHMPITWIGIVLTVLSFAIANVLSNDPTWAFLDINYPCSGLSIFLLTVYPRPRKELLLAPMCGAMGLLWAVNSSASNWVAVAVAGFFLGPNTPGIFTIISTRVPPSLKGIVVSITLGLGLVGSTLGPLIFGIVAGKVSPGLRILPPVIIVLACLSALFFWTIPPRRKVD